MTAASSSQLEPSDLGRTVGNYELVELLGRGGMGAVYLGVHQTLATKVAIKIILGELAPSAEMQHRFFEEARLAASLDHPAIVGMLDFATLPDGRPYLVMEYLDGEPLIAMAKRLGALPVADAAAIAVAALDGLAVAHAAGVIHRDIKPHNLFVIADGDRGRLKILDFGLAKAQAAPKGVTRTGAILGTPGFMAPEQGTHAKADARSDVYAVGAVLYELVAGKPPWTSDDWIELLHLHRTAALPPIENVSDDVFAIVARALAKKPDDRFASAKEMADALRPFAGKVPVPERRTLETRARTSAPASDQVATRALRATPPAAGGPAPANHAPELEHEPALPSRQHEQQPALEQPHALDHEQPHVLSPREHPHALPAREHEHPSALPPRREHEHPLAGPERGWLHGRDAAVKELRPDDISAPYAPPTGISAKRIGIATALLGVAVLGIAWVVLSKRGPETSKTAVADDSRGSGPSGNADLKTSDASAAAGGDTAGRDAGVTGDSIANENRDTGAGDNNTPTRDAGTVVGDHTPAGRDAGARDAGTRHDDAATTSDASTGDTANARDAGVTPDAAIAVLPGGGSAGAPEQFLIYDVPTPAAWDYHARIGHVQQIARRVFADAKLVHIGGSGIRPDGTLNLTANRGTINYTFRSPSRSVRGSRLKGERWTCLVSIGVRGDFIQVGTADSECSEPWLAARCSGGELWKIAQTKGAVPDQVANLYLYVYDVGWVWNLNTNEGKFEILDADCP